jgi:hypothetical protein
VSRQNQAKDRIMIFFHYGDYDYKDVNYYSGFVYRFPEHKMPPKDLAEFSEYLCSNFIEGVDVHVISTVRDVLDYCIQYCKKNNVDLSVIRTVMNNENGGLGVPISKSGDYNIMLKLMKKLG